MSKTWFTSDFHLFHDNIIKYCNRPFNNIWEMHDAIIQGVNETIAPNDELFILGDVSFYGGKKVTDILEKMHGQKHLIIGNHDSQNMPDWSGWRSVNHYLEIRRKGQNIVLCHYPIESWKNMSHGWIHLHGHRHGVPGRYDGHPSNKLRGDVGVDPWNFKPVGFDDLTKKWLKEGKLV